MRSDPTAYPQRRIRPDHGAAGVDPADPIRLGAPAVRETDHEDDAPGSAYRPPLYQPLRGGGALSLTRSPIIAGRAGTTVLSRRSIVVGLPDATPVPMRASRRPTPVTPTALPGASLAKLVPVQFTPRHELDGPGLVIDVEPAEGSVGELWPRDGRAHTGTRDWAPYLPDSTRPALVANTAAMSESVDQHSGGGRRQARLRARSSGRARRVLLLAAGGLMAVVGAAYGAALAYAGQNVPRGTTVLGVPIGGMSAPAAERKLNTAFGPRAAAPISVLVGARTFTVHPETAGLGFDPHGTARDAAQHSYDPMVVLPALFRHERAVPPKVTVDAVKLDGALAAIARRTDVKLREGSVSFDGGRARPVYPQAGALLDVSEAAAKLANLFPAAQSVTLPVRARTPQVSADAVDQAVSGFGARAMSGPLRLALDGSTATLTPTEVGRTLSMRPTSTGLLEPHVDTTALVNLVGGRLGAVESPARDATFGVVAGKPVLTPSRDGRTIDPLGLSTSVVAALDRTSDRVAKLSMVHREPEFSTEDARALGLSDVIGSYTGTFSAGSAVSGNIRRAAHLIAGSVVMPGQSWSFNQRVGERVPANGFSAGISVTDGRSSPDYGAGTGQVATAVFNAAFQAGLTDVRHSARTSYSDVYPLGRDAVVSWPGADLVFRNDTGHPIYLDADSTGGAVTVSVLGTRWYTAEKITTSARYALVAAGTRHLDGRSCTAQSSTPGFDVDVVRTLTRGPGGAPERSTVHTHYAPADRIVCGGGASAGSASPSAAARAGQHPADHAKRSTATPSPNSPTG